MRLADGHGPYAQGMLTRAQACRHHIWRARCTAVDDAWAPGDEPGGGREEKAQRTALRASVNSLCAASVVVAMCTHIYIYMDKVHT